MPKAKKNKKANYQMGGVVNPVMPSNIPPYGDGRDSAETAAPISSAQAAPAAPLISAPPPISAAPINPYNTIDARNRSQMYMEHGGKVEANEYKKGGKVEYSKSNPGDTTSKKKKKKTMGEMVGGDGWKKYGYESAEAFKRGDKKKKKKKKK